MVFLGFGGGLHVLEISRLDLCKSRMKECSIAQDLYLYCCLALDLVTVAPPWLRGSFQIQILLDPTRRGTTARMARYYRSHGTTASMARYYRSHGTTASVARYYRAPCGTNVVLLPQSRYYRDPSRYYRVWSSSKTLVSHPMAVPPSVTSIAC